MKKAFLFSCSAALALAACGQEERSVEMSEAMAEPAADAAAPQAATDAREATVEASIANDLPAIPASMPQLAYDYGMAFELESTEIGKLMRRHANVCEQQGPASCRIVGMDLSGRAEDDDVRGKLSLAVASNHARAVTALLEDEAADSGAELASSSIGSEEVSKQVVDTEARIRAREELRDRLLEVLRTRKGSVRELVEAERSVAAVNEEIDQAKSWLAETKGRVAFSRMDIDYAPPSGAASEFTAPIEGALGSLGGIFGSLVAVLLVLLAIALPIGGAIAGVLWLRRRLAVAAAV
jgi:ribosomal protein L10